MTDLISRQAAIDALDGKIEITGRTNAEAVKGYVRLVKDRLERLPFAQPEQQWIPVTERLPEDEQPVLFSIKTGRVHQGKYYNDGSMNQWYSALDKMRAFNNVVNAWMPLPEPYAVMRGEEDALN